jgi:hypothetical protein
MCCTSYESSNYGRGRCGRLSRHHRLNMQWSSPVCNTILFCRRWLIYRNAQSAPEAIDASLPPSELIADAVKRSSRAHMFHFYSLLCEIASVPRKSPNAWIAADRLATFGGPTAGKEKERAAGAHINHGGKPKQASTTAGTITTTGSGAVSNLGHVLSFDAQALARECLKEVGRELGVPQ